MQNTIVYLFGFSGTGKLTIAQALGDFAAFTIVDNQLINAPVFKAVAADGVKPLPLGVWREIRKIREAVFNTLTYMSPKEMNFVLTNELFTEIDGDKKLFEEVEAIAETRGAKFLPVRLICEKEELLKRVQNPDRKKRLKQIDAESLRTKIQDFTVLKPSHKNLCELDVTSLSAQDAAKIIWNKLGELS